MFVFQSHLSFNQSLKCLLCILFLCSYCNRLQVFCALPVFYFKFCKKYRNKQFPNFLLICKNRSNKTEHWRNGIMSYRTTALNCSQLFLVVNVSFKINCWGETSDHIIRVFIIYCVSKAKHLETTHRIVKVLQYGKLSTIVHYIYLSVCKLEKSVKICL